ncbi:Uncharacterised protein [uncultured archaeon]|nr:Uncharacterised protein [uncultured archaeon]
MMKQLTYLVSILAIMMIGSIVALAQDGNASANSTALINITENSTTSSEVLNTTTESPVEENDSSFSNTSLSSAPATADANNTSLAAADLDTAIKASQKLSTVNNETLDTVSISNIAKKAPDVAVVASSAQSSKELEGAYKLGDGVGGLNPFNPKHKIVKPLELGIATKPLRDTSKMYFVCDIV